MAPRTKHKERPRQAELINRFPYFLLTCHEKLLYLILLLKGPYSMKLRHLFKFILLLQITVFSDAYSAASSPSPEEIFETTPLTGFLKRVVIRMPKGSNCFTIKHDGTKGVVTASYVTADGETSLPTQYINESLLHGGNVTEHEESLHIRGINPDDLTAIEEAGEIVNTVGTYKSGQSIYLTAGRFDMTQTGFVWDSSDEDHCILSAPKNCLSPLRGIELIGGEKDSDGRNRALAYGAINFEATSLKDTFVSSKNTETPDDFKGGFTVLGVEEVIFIIEGTEAGFYIP